MSQSDAHRDLVQSIVEKLAQRYPGINLNADLQQFPGDELPPLIDNYRPDVYARQDNIGLLVIAEAKTDNDIDDPHTRAQLTSFISYLEKQKQGCFVFVVTGVGAARAKTLLRFMRMELQVKNTRLEVFDTCDLWLLDSQGGVQWLLT